MTDLWPRASEILGEALELPDEERHAFVEASCVGDTTLRLEVEALLAIDTSAQGASDRPVFDFHSVRQPLAPDRIGAFEVLATIGHGGMSTVYRCRRGGVRDPQQVAIKVLKRGLQSDDLVRRFRREGNILARLRHQYIAAVLGGGVLDDGRPYLVMTYVDGEPVDRFCQAGVGLHERLGLFLRICDAVQYAHRSLVVHRDLKPSNILVTADGEPRLLDFGIAKLLDPETDVPWTMTRTGLQLLTPAYASPEQIVGGTITTACDVYSLGVVLFELLTGRRPFELETTESERLRRIGESEPPRASAVAAAASPEVLGDHPETRRRQLRGDLDTVLAKALAKRPEERYRSVADLAADLRRALENRPILARPATVSYRVRKFLSRHRLGVAAVLSAVVGLGVITVERELQRQRAERAVTRSESIQEFLVGIFEEAVPLKGSGLEVPLGEVLERSRSRLEDLKGDPELQTDLMVLLGGIYIELAVPGQAEPVLREALEVRRRSLGTEHPQTAEVRCLLGRVEANQGNLEAARRAMETALSGLRTSGAQDSKTANCLNELATLQQRMGLFSAAEKSFLEALEIALTVGGPDSHEAIGYRNNLGILYRRQGRLEEAESVLAKVYDALLRTGASASFRGLVLSNLAVIRYELGEMSGVGDALRDALEAYRRYYGDSHPQTAVGLKNLGIFERDWGRLEDALLLLQEQLALLLRHYGDEHFETAKASVDLAAVEQRLGRPRAAEERVRAAMEILERTLGPSHPQVARGADTLGLVQLDQGRPAAALASFDKALRIRQATAQGSFRTALSQANRGRARLHTGNVALAIEDLQQALARSVANLGESHRVVAQQRAWLAGALRLGARFEEASGEIELAVKSLEKVAVPPRIVEEIRAEERRLLTNRRAIEGDTDTLKPPGALPGA